ncbi:MAG: hypothetical protein GYA23_04245 [Methanomicrobiales archaeon]|nr:hypothetical protein [Methanomicrobiales archaeon]
MAGTESPHSPLARLVLFMVCMAIAGSLVAGTHYYAIDLPQQKNVQTPENAENNNINCILCLHNCQVDSDPISCRTGCKDLECAGVV